MSKDGPLYKKFIVTRTDGKHHLGEKHYDCQYFVLDITHDPYALPAIAAYAKSCEREYPLLSADLWNTVIAQGKANEAKEAADEQ